MVTGVKISELAAATALTGSEAIPLVQGGATDRAAASAIATYVTQVSTSFTQAGLNAVARTPTSKLQEVISVADFGAYGDGTDQTTALLAAHARLKLLAEAGTPVRLIYPFGGDYRTSATLPLPNASEWEIEGKGHPEITCTGSNIPIFQMVPTAPRFGFKISGLVFAYSANQPSTNTRAVGVEFHVTTDIPDGLYDFSLDDLRFSNCYRGIAVSTPAITAAYNFPTWAFVANRIRGFTGMSGSVMALGNFGSTGGSPCALVTGFRSQCPNAVEPALYFSRLSQIVIISPEILQHKNRAIQFSTCRNPWIQNIRVEFPTINTLNSEMIVSDSSEGYVRVDGIEIQSPTIAVGGGNFGYVVSAFTARIIVSRLILKTPTVTSGTLVMLWPRSGGTFTVEGKPTFDTPGTSVMYRGVDAASVSFSDAQDDRFWKSAIGASVSYANIDNGSPTKTCVMGRSGVVLGQYVKTSAAVAAGTLNSRIQIRGTTLAAATVTMTSGTAAAGYVTPGNDPTDGSASYFSAGDSLTVQLQTDGSFSPTPDVDVTVMVAYF